MVLTENTFTYNGLTSTSYGLRFVWLDEDEPTTMSSEKEYEYYRNHATGRFNIIGSKHEDPLSFPVDIIANKVLTDTEVRTIYKKLFNQSTFKTMTVVRSSTETLSFRCIFINPQVYDYGLGSSGGVVGFKATMVLDSPFLNYGTKTQTITFTETQVVNVQNTPLMAAAITPTLTTTTSTLTASTKLSSKSPSSVGQHTIVYVPETIDGTETYVPYYVVAKDSTGVTLIRKELSIRDLPIRCCLDDVTKNGTTYNVEEDEEGFTDSLIGTYIDYYLTRNAVSNDYYPQYMFLWTGGTSSDPDTFIDRFSSTLQSDLISVNAYDDATNTRKVFLPSTSEVSSWTNYCIPYGIKLVKTLQKGSETTWQLTPLQIVDDRDPEYPDRIKIMVNSEIFSSTYYSYNSGTGIITLNSDGVENCLSGSTIEIFESITYLTKTIVPAEDLLESYQNQGYSVTLSDVENLVGSNYYQIGRYDVDGQVDSDTEASFRSFTSNELNSDQPAGIRPVIKLPGTISLTSDGKIIPGTTEQTIEEEDSGDTGTTTDDDEGGGSGSGTEEEEEEEEEEEGGGTTTDDDDDGGTTTGDDDDSGTTTDDEDDGTTTDPADEDEEEDDDDSDTSSSSTSYLSFKNTSDAHEYIYPDVDIVLPAISTITDSGKTYVTITIASTTDQVVGSTGTANNRVITIKKYPNTLQETIKYRPQNGTIISSIGSANAIQRTNKKFLRIIPGTNTFSAYCDCNNLTSGSQTLTGDQYCANITMTLSYKEDRVLL